MLQDDNLKLKEKFLDYFRQLPIQKLAAGAIGRSEDTITDWKAADKDFSDQIESAKSEWALKKVKGVKSKEWLLERILRDHFTPRQELTGADGKDLNAPPTKEEIAEILKKYAPDKTDSPATNG